jgi:hypothetical protein
MTVSTLLTPLEPKRTLRPACPKDFLGTIQPAAILVGAFRKLGQDAGAFSV